MIDEPDYRCQKAQYEFELTSLIVPEANAVAEASGVEQASPITRLASGVQVLGIDSWVERFANAVYPL